MNTLGAGKFLDERIEQEGQADLREFRDGLANWAVRLIPNCFLLNVQCNCS